MDKRSVLVHLELDQGLNPVGYWVSVQRGSREVAVKYSTDNADWYGIEQLATDAYETAAKAVIELGWWK